MARIAIDTSVIIAGLLSWHEQHRAALAALKAAMGAGNQVIVPLPVLLEAYAVMTRLPAPHRLSPFDAHELLAGSFAARAKIAALQDTDAWALLQELSAKGVAGGATYDAVILACARQAGAERLLTLNRRHFARIAGDITLVTP